MPINMLLPTGDQLNHPGQEQLERAVCSRFSAASVRLPSSATATK
jgi:hypothetical protein